MELKNNLKQEKIKHIKNKKTRGLRLISYFDPGKTCRMPSLKAIS